MRNLPDHFMVSEVDGALYDTRLSCWAERPVRPEYTWSFSDIKTVAQLKATIRAGAYAWPGGYPLYFVTRDAAALCFDCVTREIKQVIWSIKNHCNDGFLVDHCVINYECAGLTCAHCDCAIESAYHE